MKFSGIDMYYFHKRIHFHNTSTFILRVCKLRKSANGLGLIRPLKDPIAREGLKDLNNLERHINYWSNYKTALIFLGGHPRLVGGL